MDGTDTQIGAHARGGGLPHAHSYNSTMAAVQQQQRADLVGSLFLPERAERVECSVGRALTGSLTGSLGFFYINIHVHVIGDHHGDVT